MIFEEYYTLSNGVKIPKLCILYTAERCNGGTT